MIQVSNIIPEVEKAIDEFLVDHVQYDNSPQPYSVEPAEVIGSRDNEWYEDGPQEELDRTDDNTPF